MQSYDMLIRMIATGEKHLISIQFETSQRLTIEICKINSEERWENIICVPGVNVSYLEVR